MKKLKPGNILIGVTEIDPNRPRTIPAVPKGGKLPEPKQQVEGSNTAEKFRSIPQE